MCKSDKPEGKKLKPDSAKNDCTAYAESMDKLRFEIDRVDAELLKFLNQRAVLSQRVGKLKKAKGGEIFQPKREKELLDRLSLKSCGPLPEEDLRAIYREILSSSRGLQK